MKKAILLSTIACGLLLSSQTAFAKKNVLFLLADDFNYWAKCIGYYDQAQTPNLDSLAKRGVLFTDAHCSSPVCNPSRNAFMSGVRPSTSKISGNSDGYIRNKPGFENIVTMNQFFTQEGYYTYAGGKIYHPGSMGGSDTDKNNWTAYTSQGSGCNGGPLYKWSSDAKSNYGWSANPDPMTTGNCNDFALAEHMANKISTYSSSDPFFIACGFFRPHMPWNSPKSFWDKFQTADMTIPPGYNESQDSPGNNVHQEVVNEGVWMQGIHAYLASMALADSMVGIVIDALNNSAHKDSTIIVFSGDHGWHLGEKGHWGKFNVRDEANHTTFIIYDPTANGNGTVCEKVVSLQDIYPTLADLCGLEAPWHVEGNSLAPLLDNPVDPSWTHPIVFTYNGNNYIKTNDYRFIDHSSEKHLYDLGADPYRWNNLYGQTGTEDILADLQHTMDSIIAIGTDIRDSLYILAGLDPNAGLDSNKNAPGIIEAEHFDFGGEGVAYHDTEAENKLGAYRIDEGVDIEECAEGGYNIGYVLDGEWLKYTLDTVIPGYYDIHLRLASKKGNATFSITENDVLLGSIICGVTGTSWQSWDTKTLSNVELTGGYNQEFKVSVSGKDVNFNHIEFELIQATHLSDAQMETSGYLINTIVSDRVLYMDLTYSNPVAKVSVYNMKGALVQDILVSGEQELRVELNPYLPKGTYILKTDDFDNVVTEKFIIQ